MKDDYALRNYGIEDGCTVFVIRKRPSSDPVREYISLIQNMIHLVGYIVFFTKLFSQIQNLKVS